MNMGFENMFNNENKVLHGKDVVENNEQRVELLHRVEKAAEQLYGDIPYHNFDHAKQAVESGYEIIARCEASGVEVNSDMIRYALLFHDAGYHEDHTTKGFASKEEYSAHLAAQTLGQMGVDQGVIDSVQRCIISTHKDRTFNFLEEKIVRAADLVGLAGEYDAFKANTIKLKQEAEMFSGTKITWEEWKKSVVQIVDFYLSQDIRLTECYKDEEGGSRFHRRTRDNVERLMHDME